MARKRESNSDTEPVHDFRQDILCGQYIAQIEGMSKSEQLRHHPVFVPDRSNVFITLHNNDLHQMVFDQLAVRLPDTMPQWTEDPVEQEYRSRYVAADPVEVRIYVP